MNFPGLAGNAALKSRLAAAFDSGSIGHAYIIYGEREKDRLLLAEIIASALVCSAEESRPCISCINCRKVRRGVHPDIKYILREKDKRYYGIDIIRDMVQDASVVPNEAEKKVYIFPDGDFLTPPCQNAALKILEDPPRYAVFIILAESSGSFLETLRSRCIELFLSAEEDCGSDDLHAAEFMQIFRDGNPLDIAAFALKLEKYERSDLLLFLKGLRTALVRGMREDYVNKERYFAASDLCGRLLEMEDANVGTGLIAGALAVGFNSILK